MARLWPRQTHTGGFGQSFRTAALRQAGGFSAARWPFVLEDHEIMQQVFKLGRAVYAPDLWCVPSNRRADRAGVNWNAPGAAALPPHALRAERLVLLQLPQRRFTARALDNIKLRRAQKSWS